VTAWLLLPSPLLGPASWQPVADRLRDAGDDVAVATARGATRPADVLAAYVAAAADLEAPVVVAHSNAGLFAPAVAEAAAAPVTGYVDAALAASTGPTPLAPPAFLAFLAGLADDDGLLPPWSQWWGGFDPFPDDATRAQVEAEQPRLPLAYFHATLETPVGWESRPQAYLAFGDTYADETARARVLGWPVRRLDVRDRGGHLYLLHDPAATATALRELVSSAATTG
jgi:hypothetical protein